MRADRMIGTSPARILLTGYPGAGKTGALASLVNAGFKLRILDFDGNPESLLQYADPKMLENVDIMSLEDKIGDNVDYVGVKGTPTALNRALKALIHWQYKEKGPDGTEEVVDLGKSSAWGKDTILVVDGMTGLGTACMRRAQAMSNKTPRNMTQAVWGLAIQDQANFIEAVTSAEAKHHTIVISHLVIRGPKGENKEDTDLVKEIKQQQGDLIPTRLYPSALGWDLPQRIAQHFPVLVNLRTQYKGKTVVRRFDTYAREEMDIKLPTKVELDELGLETGLLDIFKALGHKPPNAT